MAVPVAPDQAVIALGVMSTVVAFESGRATSSKMGLMRERVREAMSTASRGLGRVYFLSLSLQFQLPPPRIVSYEA